MKIFDQMFDSELKKVEYFTFLEVLDPKVARIEFTISVVQSGAHVHVSVSGSSLADVGGLIGSYVAAKSWNWEDTVF